MFWSFAWQLNNKTLHSDWLCMDYRRIHISKIFLNALFFFNYLLCLCSLNNKLDQELHLSSYKNKKDKKRIKSCILRNWFFLSLILKKRIKFNSSCINKFYYFIWIVNNLKCLFLMNVLWIIIYISLKYYWLMIVKGGFYFCSVLCFVNGYHGNNLKLTYLCK